MDNHKAISASESLLHLIHERLETDILFECFAGLLIQSGFFNLDDIHVLPHEHTKRGYKNDIVTAPKEDKYDKTCFFPENLHEILQVYVSRSSLLDYLPEDFFIDPKVLDGKEAKEQLDNAQKFFKPLEIEYNKTRIQKELYEIETLGNFDKTLALLWNDFPITNDKWKRFVRTLHLLPFTIGDKEKTKTLIAYVLEHKVSLTFDIEECCQLNKTQKENFTGNTLGDNIQLGDVVYDYQDICTLKIKNIPASEFSDYLDETSETRRLLQEIIKFYFPMNIEVRLDFSVNYLSDEEAMSPKESIIPFLGYSSHL